MVARRVFLAAGLYGLLATVPLYVLESALVRDRGTPITYPEYYYGFAGLAVAWQLAFLVIARDPQRYRPLMPMGVLEKLGFGGAALVLWMLGRTGGSTAAFGAIDLAWAALFVLAFLKTPRAD